MPARVLIIDDDKAILELLKLVVGSQGYKVVGSTDSERALEHYSQFSPHVVILDILMPNKDGLETIREIRTWDPDAKIIAMSGGGRFGVGSYLPLAQKLGAARTLEKPFRPAEILRLVRELAVEQAPGGSGLQ